MFISNRSGFQPAGAIVCAFFTIAVVACAGTYSGGAGTAEDPFRISTVTDWQELIAASGDWDKSFILLNDIDFQGVALTPVAPDTTAQHAPFQGTPFSGIFDGQGHVVLNAMIHQPDNNFVGLFGCLCFPGQIQNLGVENLSIAGREFVGGLMGENSGTITNCYTSVTIGGFYIVGGLVGKNEGTIKACHATGMISGSSSSIGGLVGRNGIDESNRVGRIEASYATGAVSGFFSVGGLVGRNDSATITACYAAGPVSGSGVLGGLVGSNTAGTITTSFWDMETSGQAESAGGTGLTTAEMKTLSTFTSAGWDFVYSDGNPPVWKMPAGGYPALFWEYRYSGGAGTAEDPCKISAAADWQELIATSGDWDKHFVLLNDIDFGGMNLTPVAPDTNPNNEDFDGTAFTGIFEGNRHILRNTVIHLSSDFVGIFGYVGNGGQIRNLGVENVAVTGEDSVGGLCGRNSGIVSDCYATGTVSGIWDDVGGLCGFNWDGTISNCYASGTISGAWHVGGLCGTNGDFPAPGRGIISNCYASGPVYGYGGVGGIVGNNSGGSISSCYARGSVMGEDQSMYLGGLCGWNYGDLVNCYATGSVSGGYDVGGLCGLNNGTIGKCYATGSVSGKYPYVGCLEGENFDSISGCFCDPATLLTFTEAGWDFVGEAANGTGDVWRMCVDGADYPRLAWEFSEHGDFACPDGVGLEDLVYLAGRWMASTPETVGAADGNGDGKVDMVDLAMVSENWMKP